MKKITNILKKNIKIFIGIIIGLLISAGVVYADILYSSSDVSYDNTYSDLTSENVQDAIDELYNKCVGSSSSTGYVYQDGYYFGSLNGFGLYKYSSEISDFINNNNFVFLRKSGDNKYVCIYNYNSDLSGDPICFKEDNYEEESQNMLNYFGSENCQDNGTYISCSYYSSSIDSTLSCTMSAESSYYSNSCQRYYYDNYYSQKSEACNISIDDNMGYSDYSCDSN